MRIKKNTNVNTQILRGINRRHTVKVIIIVSVSTKNKMRAAAAEAAACYAKVSTLRMQYFIQQ